jgi:hypothetical protein
VIDISVYNKLAYAADLGKTQNCPDWHFSGLHSKAGLRSVCYMCATSAFLVCFSRWSSSTRDKGVHLLANPPAAWHELVSLPENALIKVRAGDASTFEFFAHGDVNPG